jgi:hypothetical protein
MVECMRVGGKWFQTLKPDDPLIRLAYRKVNNSTMGQIQDIFSLSLHSEWRIKNGVHTSFNDWIEDADNRLGIVYACLSDQYLFSHCQSLNSSSGMTNTSASYYHRLRLLGKILQPHVLFSQLCRLTEGTPSYGAERNHSDKS